MTETDASPDSADGDQAYFQAVEEVFVRYRGAPLLLSPADWQVARRWHRDGIPLELVRQVLDEVWAKRKERGAKGRISSLRYVAPAVEKAWARQRELTVTGERSAAAPLDVPARLRGLAAALSTALAAGGIHSGAAELAAEVTALEGPSPEVEERLAELDRTLLERAWDGLSAEARSEVQAAVERTLAALAGRVDPQELERSRERLRAQLVRQRLRLPVLSLFAPEAEAGESSAGAELSGEPAKESR
jgi:hypothetical protein